MSFIIEDPDNNFKHIHRILNTYIDGKRTVPFPTGALCARVASVTMTGAVSSPPLPPPNLSERVDPSALSRPRARRPARRGRPRWANLVGLAIVARIIDEHGGKITVESESGAGSVFRVLLPLPA